MQYPMSFAEKWWNETGSMSVCSPIWGHCNISLLESLLSCNFLLLWRGFIRIRNSIRWLLVSSFCFLFPSISSFSVHTIRFRQAYKSYKHTFLSFSLLILPFSYFFLGGGWDFGFWPFWKQAREQERVERFQEASQSSLSALKLNIFNSSQSDPSCDQPEDKKWSLFVYDPDRIGRSASTEYRGPPSPLLSDSWRSNSNTDGMILSKSSNIASKQDACSSVVNDSLARGSKRFRLGSDRSVHVLRALKRKMPVSPRQLVLDAPSESHRVIALQSSSYPYSSYLPRLRESFVAEPLPDSDLQDDQDVSNSSLYVEKQNISHIIVDAHADQILPECSNISFSHNIKNPPAVAATTTSCNGAESTCHRVLDESSSSASHIRRLHSNSASPSLSISSAFHSISLTTLDNDSSSGTDSSLAQIFCDMPNIIDDNGTPWCHCILYSLLDGCVSWARYGFSLSLSSIESWGGGLKRRPVGISIVDGSFFLFWLSIVNSSLYKCKSIHSPSCRSSVSSF